MDTSADLTRRLAEKLDEIPVIDVHSHLRADKPTADSLADVLLYHHVWIELVSSGMPATEVTRAGLPHELVDPEMAPEQRVRRALPYLHNIRNTLSAYFLRVILQELYGVPDGQLTSENWESVFATVAEKAARADWEDELLERRCHIEQLLTVENVFALSPTKRFGFGWEVPDVFFRGRKSGPREMLAELEQKLDAELPDADSYRRAWVAAIERAIGRGIRFVAMWLPQNFELLEPTDSAVTAVLAAARRGDALSSGERNLISSFTLRILLDCLRESSVNTLQVIMGAEVHVPHRSIPRYGCDLLPETCRLFGEYGDLHFNLSAASDLFTQDLAIIAKHFPNVSVAGYWWHTLYPFYVRKSIETRLDIVPANKHIAYFSDAYHAEWCYPKLKMVKRLFVEALGGRVESGQFSEETAVSLMWDLFHNNAKRIYLSEAE